MLFRYLIRQYEGTAEDVLVFNSHVCEIFRQPEYSPTASSLFLRFLLPIIWGKTDLTSSWNDTTGSRHRCELSPGVFL